MDGSEGPSPTRAPRWRELGLLGKLARVIAFAFVTAYLVQSVAKPLPEEHWLRVRVMPLIKQLDPLRLNSPWRMFTSAARFGHIVLLLETSSGDRYQVENFRWEGKSWLDRARDGRLRRMQAKLTQENHRRRWGRHYLSYVCETTMRDIPDATRIEILNRKPMVLDRNGKQLSGPTSKHVATFDCRTRRFTDGN